MPGREAFQMPPGSLLALHLDFRFFALCVSDGIQFRNFAVT